MAEGVSDGGPGGDRRGRGKPGSGARLGRRIALAVFWVAAVYMGIVGFYSITTQVFWPERANAWDARCEPGLRELEAELRARSAEHLAGQGSQADVRAMRRWLTDWDARHTTLEDRCEGPGADAHAALATLRHRLDALLVRYDRDNASLMRRIDQGLARVPEE